MLKIENTDKHYPICYTFTKGVHKNESYKAIAKICKNPICVCNLVHLTLIPDNKNKRLSGQNIEYNVSLDINSKTVSNETKGVINFNFAKALTDDFAEQDWNEIISIYHFFKTHATENTDLTTLDVSFPDDVIKDESVLISYKEIFPYSTPIFLNINQFTLWVDELYCVNPQCDCNDVHLIFVPFLKNDAVVDKTLKDTYIILNLNDNTWKIENRGHAKISANKIMTALFEHINPEELFKKHHKTLRLLYIKFRNKQKKFQSTGRNDPCPCGSGKKYKKCCLLKGR